MQLEKTANKMRKQAIKQINELMAIVKRNGWTCVPEGHILYRLIGKGGHVNVMETRVKRLIERYNDIKNPYHVSSYMKRVLRILNTLPHLLYDHVKRSPSEYLKNLNTMTRNIAADNDRHMYMHEHKECICYL